MTGNRKKQESGVRKTGDREQVPGAGENQSHVGWLVTCDCLVPTAFCLLPTPPRPGAGAARGVPQDAEALSESSLLTEEAKAPTSARGRRVTSASLRRR